MTPTCCAAPAEIGLRRQNPTRRQDQHGPATSPTDADFRDMHELVGLDLMVSPFWSGNHRTQCSRNEQPCAAETIARESANNPEE